MPKTLTFVSGPSSGEDRADLPTKKLFETGSNMICRIWSSQVYTLPKAKSQTRNKQNKDMHKCSSVYSERGVPLPVLTSGGE